MEGMQVIRNLVWGKSEEQNAVCNAGGIEAIITGMQVMRPSVVLEGCTHLFPLRPVYCMSVTLEGMRHSLGCTRARALYTTIYVRPS